MRGNLGREVASLLKRCAYALLYLRPLIGVIYLPRFLRDLYAYRKISRNEKIGLMDMYPCLLDKVTKTPFDAHYFYQGAWLARKVADFKPKQHVDIGSSVMTIGVLSGFVETTFVDYRPLKVQLPGLACRGGDISQLPFESGSVESLSCLHVIEHIGLGRYGDPIDPEGSRKAANELARVVAPGGRLYLTVPVGRARVCFNAHRVFAPQEILNMFPGFCLADFSWVDDAGHFHVSGKPEDAAVEEYACGLYEFVGNLNV